MVGILSNAQRIREKRKEDYMKNKNTQKNEYVPMFLSWCKSFEEEINEFNELIRGNPEDVDLLKAEYERLKQKRKLTSFEISYIETALWASTDDNGNPLDKQYSFDDLADETFNRIQNDCVEFQNKAGELLDDLSDSQVAHDFWLTRNHHGAGFWDGDYEKDTGEKLTKLSEKFGECDLYVGDDGKLYIM